MGEWFTPNIIGGAQERVPGGRAAGAEHVDRAARLHERLGDMRDEVAAATAVRETYATAADFADVSIATRAARAPSLRAPVQPRARADKTPLDAFFERQARTTNEAIGSFAEWDGEGNRVKTLARMPRMPELRHKLTLGELGAPLSAQQLLSTDALRRQAFERAAIARDAAAVAERRAAFEPVERGLRGVRGADVAADPALAAALRALKHRVALVDRHREIAAALSRRTPTSSREHGEWWEHAAHAPRPEKSAS
ncbi:hypothetical protein KFE25_000446 [Diacronema lutheri]|uniref:Uncharacterized protein n=1 Tax=Diacronema lutheri TaxID=2081491 RepID=A0A8J5XSK6_DIALT|nr:hypothetical protein KFE25_000446 [Diacronema lutheri]